MLLPIKSPTGFGLLRNTQAVLPTCYDAVWQLPYGFWGFRLGAAFGVLAADGQEVSPCRLPATFTGFAELALDEEMEAFLEADATFIPFMRRRFPALHLHGTKLCQPSRWLAEAITPHLADADGEVLLYTAACCLVLRPGGTWQWREHPDGARATTRYYASQYPPDSFRPAVPTEFAVADVEDLVRWRLCQHELTQTLDDPQRPSEHSWALADGQARAHHLHALHEVLTSSGLCWRKPAAHEEDTQPELS